MEPHKQAPDTIALPLYLCHLAGIRELLTPCTLVSITKWAVVNLPSSLPLIPSFYHSVWH